MAKNGIVESFCTPPAAAETDMDKKLLSDAEPGELSFEGIPLKTYSWGTGRNVLLAHGWGSRASHLAFIGRSLAGAGFHVMAFDGPAHGNSLKKDGRNISNMFEYCRALKCTADKMKPLYAVIGHSMGATAAAFTVLGHERLSDYQIKPERLVMISPPSGIFRMAEHFCLHSGLPDKVNELAEGLENDFGFSMKDYCLPDIIGNIKSRLLIIHDEDDEEIPVSDSLDLKKAYKDAELLLTKGAGHQRILFSREALRGIKNFIGDKNAS